MKTIDEQDQEIEATLRRAAGHLARRGSEYLEHSVLEQHVMNVHGARGRRLLVAVVAATALCVTAIAASFIGSTSSGKVNKAMAAWSAVPKDATTAQIEDITSSCGVDESYISSLEGGTFDNFPQFLLEPSLVELRGTTLLAVYFTPTHVIMCVQFEDRSVSKTAGNMAWQSELWRDPFALEFHFNNGKTLGTMVIGFLPGSRPITSADNAGQNDSSSHWEVDIYSPGVGHVSASVQQHLKRFVAWMPGIVSGEVNFVNTVTGEKEADIKFDTPKYTTWNVSPITTIVGRPNN